MIETFITEDSGSAAKESKQTATRPQVICEAKNTLGATSIAAHLATVSECDKLKNRCEAFVLEHPCILVMAKVAKELDVVVADNEKGKAIAKTAATNGGERKRPNDKLRRVVDLKTLLKSSHNAQKESIEATGAPNLQATDIAI